ncbi:MAG: FixH family protein [Bacteriovorax sp.]|jgi:hypothetical protein
MAKKKIAVLFLFGLIATALIFIKNEFKGSQTDSQFIILNWQHSPDKITTNGPVEFTISLKDKKNGPIKNAQIDVEATMNHAGMKPVMAQAKETGGGVYKVKIQLTMDGGWILFLTIKKEDGTIIKKEITFKTESR